MHDEWGGVTVTILEGRVQKISIIVSTDRSVHIDNYPKGWPLISETTQEIFC